MDKNVSKTPTPTPNFIERWDSINLLQRITLVCLVMIQAGGRMAKIIAVMIVCIVIAAAVYLASRNWLLALAVGIFLGWVISELSRMFKKM